jgi:hypothetical protein
MEWCVDSRPLRRSSPAGSRSRPARPIAWAALVLVCSSIPTGLSADSTQVAVRDSSDISGTITPPPPGQIEVLPALEEPFRPGESLKFSVQYGPIHAGSAYLEVPEVSQINGRAAYRLVARAESNSFFSHFYKVRNVIESRWDSVGHFSISYTENRREGGTKSQSEIHFDSTLNEALYPDGHVYSVPPNVQDALSSFYYTRMQALPLGGSVVFDYHASRRSQPLEVRVLGRERVKTPAGTFDCIAVEPILKAGGIFKNKGRLVIWLTDDAHRMPVLMKSKVAIGSISVILQSARLGGGG